MRWDLAQLNIRLVNYLGLEIVVTIENPNEATVLDLKKHLQKKFPRLPLAKQVSCLYNNEIKHN
jgi:hypothetical protein